jgi:hypothetical protein
MTQQDTIRMKAALGFERTAPEGSGEGTESIKRGDEFDATQNELRDYFLSRQERPLATPVNLDDLGDVPVGGIPRSQVQDYLRSLSDEERTDLLAEFAPAGGDAGKGTSDPGDAGKVADKDAGERPSGGGKKK